MVPNAALRWKPRPSQIDPEFAQEGRDGSEEHKRRPSHPRRRRRAADKSAKPGKEQDEPSRIWVPTEGFVRPVEVVVGPSDGTNTEISGEGVQQGLKVVIGEGHKEDEDSDTTNPFMPQLKGPSQKPKQ